jgi:predicted phage terminase large subunit-like protein
MESIETLRPLFKELKKENGQPLTDEDLTTLAKARHRFRTDAFYLGNQILDFNFQEDVHTALFDMMVPKDVWVPIEAFKGVKRRLILWPRLHYKTSAEVVEIIQLILCDPNITILLVSGVVDLTKEIFEMVRNAFENNEKMAQTFPEYCGKKLTKNSKLYVKCRTVKGTKRGGTLNISTQKSTKSGIHADVVFLDDLQHDQNYQNPKLLEKVHKAYVAFAGPIMKDGGLLYVFGTRYVQNDVYGTILDTITHKGLAPLKPYKSYQISPTWTEANQISADGQWLVSIRSCWKKQFKPDGTLDKVELLFPKRIDKRTGEPKGFSLENLLQMLRDDPIHFVCQMENNPNPGGQQIFTEELFEKSSVIAQQLPQLGPVICIWDLAWSEKVKADRTVGIAVRVASDRRAYIIDAVAGRFDPTTLVKWVILLANRHKANKVYVEESPGAKLLRPSMDYFCKLNKIRGVPLEFIGMGRGEKGMKDIRINALQPVMNAGRILFFSGMEMYDELKDEFLKYPTAPHDDFPDAVSRLIDLLPTIDATSSPIDDLIRRKEQQQQPAAERYSPHGGIGGILCG